MHPQAGSNFAFDDPGGSPEAHAIDRTSDELAPGSHAVTVQWAVLGGGQWILDDWQLTLELWKI